LRTHDITVVIPTIPVRGHELARAVTSVAAQTYAAAALITREDHERLGAPHNRHTALMQVTTPWVAFLDDDDEFKPEHLEVLVAAQQLTNADYVYSWYDVIGGTDPLPHFGKPFDPCDPIQTTITTLVRTELAQEVGFIHPHKDELTPDGNTYGEDYAFTIRCNDLGAYIYHTPYRTWNWYHHGANTSGRPDRWSMPGDKQSSVDVVFPRR
jgi:glycosyltransferase involved in cell wall biosynthesis